MTNRIIAGVACGLLLAGSPAAEAANVGGLNVNAVGTGWGYEGTYVTLSREITWAEAGYSCGAGTGSNVAIILPNHAMRKDVTDIAKLALATGKTVSVYLEGCVGGGFFLKAAGIYR